MKQVIMFITLGFILGITGCKSTKRDGIYYLKKGQKVINKKM